MGQRFGPHNIPPPMVTRSLELGPLECEICGGPTECILGVKGLPAICSKACEKKYRRPLPRKRFFKFADWRVVMKWEGSTNFEFFRYSGADGKIWEQVASGTVKWDGDIHFHLVDDGYIHLGENEWADLCACLAWVQGIGDIGRD